MRIFLSVILLAGLAGCDSLPPLEDRDREKEFAELDIQAKHMQKSMESARRDARDAMKQAQKQ